MTKNATAKLWNPYLWSNGKYASYPQPSYATSFPNTSNPLDPSDWTNGGIASALNRTNMQSTPGKGFGTMHDFNGTDLADSGAHLSSFPSNHSARGVIAANSLVDGIEIELLLRAQFTSTSFRCYELNVAYYPGAGGCGIGCGLIYSDVANPNRYHTFREPSFGEITPATGAEIYASLIDNTITCQWKPSGGSFSTLFTVDITDFGTTYYDGNPGFGAWNLDGAANNGKLAFSSYEALGL